MIKNKVGYGGDLWVPSAKYINLTGGCSTQEVKTLLGVGDLFLVHDKVSFRTDHVTIGELFKTFTMDDMDELIKNDRISFYSPLYSPHYKNNWYDEIEESLTKIPPHILREPIEPSRAIQKVLDNLESPIEVDEDYNRFKVDMDELFYKLGIQRDSFFTMDTVFAFNQAIEKTRELWKCGIFSLAFDPEVLHYFDICDKASFLKENNLQISELNSVKHEMVDELHSFKNLPSISELIVSADKPVKTFMDIVNSTEAAELRKWIQSIEGNDVDVRDLYQSSMSKLPSKNFWVDWTRFGSVTAISSILGTILTANPAVGVLLGAAAGAVDKEYGGKLIDKTSKEYNPDTWFSFIQKTVS